MTPTDLRDATFTGLRAELHGRLQQVYDAWLIYGPCTTRQLAHKSEIDILNVRPRTTDLLQLGLVELIGSEGTEGIYQPRTAARWEAWAAAQRGERAGSQLNLI